MQLALRITIAALVSIVAAGCRAWPTPTAPKTCESAAIVATAPAKAILPTLRYLRTARTERELDPDMPDAPEQYWDVLELHNGTGATFERVAHMGCDWIWTRCYGVVDVFVPGVGWTDPQSGVAYCGTGAGYQQILPGESVTIRTISWLRPTRVSVSVRTVEGRDWYVMSEQDLREFVELPFVAYDSARAAPDAKPPALFWGQRTTRGE